MAAAKDKDQEPQIQTAGEAEASVEAGAEQVQEKVDQETAQGFVGVKADPTDNHAYSVAGVLAGEPTPETDAEHAEAVRRERRANGLG
jgi:hypothetical protein